MKFKQSLKMGFKILQMMLALLIIVHWVGCFWYIVVNDSLKSWVPPKHIDEGVTDFYEL